MAQRIHGRSKVSFSVVFKCDRMIERISFAGFLSVRVVGVGVCEVSLSSYLREGSKVTSRVVVVERDMTQLIRFLGDVIEYRVVFVSFSMSQAIRTRSHVAAAVKLPGYFGATTGADGRVG